ncbi:hypothetical protein SCALM49S_08915 [Streptomyces californicus]
MPRPWLLLLGALGRTDGDHGLLGVELWTRAPGPPGVRVGFTACRTRGYVRGAMPSRTIERYWRAISSGLCCPPGRYQEAATQTVSRTKR